MNYEGGDAFSKQPDHEVRPMKDFVQEGQIDKKLLKDILLDRPYIGLTINEERLKEHLDYLIRINEQLKDRQLHETISYLSEIGEKLFYAQRLTRDRGEEIKKDNVTLDPNSETFYEDVEKMREHSSNQWEQVQLMDLTSSGKRKINDLLETVYKEINKRFIEDDQRPEGFEIKE